jgi:beta-lactamase superfamily II metal-dependent hydrolase
MSKVFRIELLPALHGDCIWVEYGQAPATHHLLIDGGPLGSFEALDARVRKCEGSRRIELFVITHIDADHIEGAVKLLNRTDLAVEFRDIWFNGWKQVRQALSGRGSKVVPPERSPAQGEYLAVTLEGRKDSWNRWFYGRAVMVPDEGPLPRITLDGGLHLTLLSPNAEKLKALRPAWLRSMDKFKVDPDDTEFFRTRLAKDPRYRSDSMTPIVPDSVAQAVAAQVDLDDAVANGSSIAFVAEYADKRCAFLADAHMQVIEPAIARLASELGVSRVPLDAVKVSHHGSARNITERFLAKIECSRFLISTDGSHDFDHPDDAAIECILAGARGARLYFNYRSEQNRKWEEPDRKHARGNYSTVYPQPGDAGVCLDLLAD